MAESRQGSLLAGCVAVVEQALAAVLSARRCDITATRRELRGTALALANAARMVGETEVSAAIERSLYVSAGLTRCGESRG